MRRFLTLLLLIVPAVAGAQTVGGANIQFYPSQRDLVKVLARSVTVVGNDADTNEKNLWTYTVPGGTLAQDGDTLRLTACGYAANNANNKAIAAYFGATQIALHSGTSFQNVQWCLLIEIARTGAATQWVRENGLWQNIMTTNPVNTAPGETLSSNVVLRVTGQSSPVGTANDIQLKYVHLELVR